MTLAGAAPAPPEVPWDPALLARVAPDRRVEALVADLANPDHAVRERASAALLDPAIPDEQVWLRLARAREPLPAEVHLRLLDAARSRILEAPRGALGIQMAGRFGEGSGVTVTSLIPHMPARKVLRPGDRIVSLDGQDVPDSARLSEIVQAHRPGDRIRAVIMRGERDAQGRVRGGPDGRPVETRLEVEVEVGARDDLERFGDRMMVSPREDEGRRRMADALERSFPPPVREVEARRAPGEDPDVSVHPYIAELEASMRSMDAAGPVDPAGVLAQRLAQLRGMAHAPGLTQQERDWFAAAARRYEELISALHGPAGAPPGGTAP